MKYNLGATFALLLLSYGLSAQVHTTANQDVGIGTTFPESKLHVLGTTTIGGNGSSTLIINDIPGARYKINTGAYNLDFSQHNAVSGLYESRLLLSNGHLPDVPTAQKIGKEGQDLGEMNRLLLQKVEELTLYIIQQEDKIKTIEEKLERIQHAHFNVK